MDETERSLVIILSMHRSGSSLSTGILQSLGMSLGPFELLGANSGNPHGHFEANVILELSRTVQMLAHGFPEDVPDSPETLSRFLGGDGQWDESVEIPEELVERGRGLIRSLVDSGNISGFKDPRTVLIWPFWERVLAMFPGLRVVPVVLLRSPHEIAMSVFSRSQGQHGYQSSLDVTAVHLGRLRSIVERWSEPVPRVRLGGIHYESDLAEAARRCGLSWDPERSERLLDRSCVHQNPAKIVHPAQRLYDSLCAEEGPADDPPSNLAIIEADGFTREALYRERIDATRNELDGVRHSLRAVQDAREQAGTELARAHEQLRQTQERLQQIREEMQQALKDARVRHDETQAHLSMTHRSLEETRERLRLTCEVVLGRRCGEHDRQAEECRDLEFEYRPGDAGNGDAGSA